MTTGLDSHPGDCRGAASLKTKPDVVRCRQIVRLLAQQLMFSMVGVTKITTVASELGRNTVVYGGGGEMRWAALDVGGRRGLRLAFEDWGPGIPDLELALRDGWTSSGGMGLGMPGSKRLVDEFDVRSAVGSGTCVTVTSWR